MLVNNFRPLISFYADSDFKDVLGNTIAKKNYLSGQLISSSSSSDVSKVNGHNYLGSCLNYNYNITPNTNSFTKEKEYYNWENVVATDRSSTVKDNNYAYSRYNGMVLFVGTGDTPVTAEDYCLAEAKELSVTGASCVHSSNEKTAITRTFVNETGEDVTIKEVGAYIFFTGYGNTGNGSYNYPVVMIGRKVLDEPVTMAVGDSYTFTYIIDMSNISF